MSGTDFNGPLWAASVGLVIAGALIAAIGLRPIGEERCRWPTSAEGLASFAGADEVRDKSQTGRGNAIVWYEGSWSSDVSIGGEVVAQLVVTAALSDYVLDPLWMMPGFALETDLVRSSTIRSDATEVPATLRINPSPPLSYAAGWIYAFEGRPVVDPVPFLLRRAFAEPFSRAMPITMISAVSHSGRASVPDRIEVVRQRLETVWADWESSCPPR